MGKAAGDEELEMVLSRQLHSHMTAVSRGTWAQVDSHIQHPSADHPHQLGLGMLPLLEMQSADYPIGRPAFVVLDKRNRTDIFGKLLLIERLEEIASVILEYAGADHYYPFYVCGHDVHSCATFSRYWPYWFPRIGSARARSFAESIQPLRYAISSRQATLSPCLFSITSM